MNQSKIFQLIANFKPRFFQFLNTFNAQIDPDNIFFPYFNESQTSFPKIDNNFSFLLHILIKFTFKADKIKIIENFSVFAPPVVVEVVDGVVG
jgi:hypothetical protein